ncbi:cohesin domain-containing protein, partial [Patescibacteria group bacterium]|nr:cohesin domain-containing protein [Patescibacteria group bacterium]
ILAAPALAATTVSFSPVSVSTASGKTFNVTISVNPQNVANYTEKIELTYPADILEVRAFNFSGSWMPLAQPGYDLIDNANGKLIKTAGYPGGLSSLATFGTVSFYAKKTGSAVIKLGSGSLALDANNQNVISGAPEVSVTVSAPVIVPVEGPTTEPTTEPIVEEPIAQQPAETQQISLIAALGVIITLGTGSVWLGILVGLIILAGLIYLAYWLRTRKSSGNIK